VIKESGEYARPFVHLKLTVGNNSGGPSALIKVLLPRPKAAKAFLASLQSHLSTKGYLVKGPLGGSSASRPPSPFLAGGLPCPSLAPLRLPPKGLSLLLPARRGWGQSSGHRPLIKGPVLRPLLLAGRLFGVGLNRRLPSSLRILVPPPSRGDGRPARSGSGVPDPSLFPSRPDL